MSTGEAGGVSHAAGWAEGRCGVWVIRVCMGGGERVLHSAVTKLHHGGVRVKRARYVGCTLGKGLVKGAGFK